MTASSIDLYSARMAQPPAPKVEPYIPASKSLPELTVGVIILGSLLSVILAGANAYLGMFAGMTVSASVPAAVISMAIFRLLRTGNILQNNGVQTAAPRADHRPAAAVPRGRRDRGGAQGRRRGRRGRRHARRRRHRRRRHEAR